MDDCEQILYSVLDDLDLLMSNKCATYDDAFACMKATNLLWASGPTAPKYSLTSTARKFI